MIETSGLVVSLTSTLLMVVI
jgi:hypothetical protein